MCELNMGFESRTDVNYSYKTDRAPHNKYNLLTN